jgi:hypothetical protein
LPYQTELSAYKNISEHQFVPSKLQALNEQAFSDRRIYERPEHALLNARLPFVSRNPPTDIFTAQTSCTSVKGTKINSSKLQSNTVSLMQAVLDLRRMLIRPGPKELVSRSGLEEFQNVLTLIQMEYRSV